MRFRRHKESKMEMEQCGYSDIHAPTSRITSALARLGKKREVRNCPNPRSRGLSQSRLGRASWKMVVWQSTWFPSFLEPTWALFITQLPEPLHVKSVMERPAGLQVGSGFLDIWIRKLCGVTKAAWAWGPRSLKSLFWLLICHWWAVLPSKVT